jgi:DMSO/TMAO reductase YedYZ molybdopterin-dependent catalytic subunit
VKRAVLAGALAGLLGAAPGAGWAGALVLGHATLKTPAANEALANPCVDGRLKAGHDGFCTVDLAVIRQLPAVTETISFLTGHGEEKGTYKGALLWAVLEKEGVVEAGGPRGRVRQEVLVTGRDGYVAALGMGEIDPAFEGKQVLLAYEGDGKAIPLRLVVPGDKRGGRAVKDVVRVETLTRRFAPTPREARP